MENYDIVKTEGAKITLTYVEDNVEKNYDLTARYVDKDECYLTMLAPPLFEKPELKKKAEIRIATSLGVFTTNTVILDCDTTFDYILFVLKTPKNYNHKEFRISARINAKFPINVKYEDEYSVDATVCNLSSSGVAFIRDSRVPDSYKNKVADIQLFLPYEDKEDSVIHLKGKLVRQKEVKYTYSDIVIAYKFSNLGSKKAELKSFIKKILKNPSEYN